jgi:hypothetical protein
MSRSFAIWRTGSAGCNIGILGTAVEHQPGHWRFIPNVSGHTSSRKFHATMEKCLPRWVGYPNHCRSVPIDPPVRYRGNMMDPSTNDDLLRTAVFAMLIVLIVFALIAIPISLDSNLKHHIVHNQPTASPPVRYIDGRDQIPD